MYSKSTYRQVQVVKDQGLPAQIDGDAYVWI